MLFTVVLVLALWLRRAALGVARRLLSWAVVDALRFWTRQGIILPISSTDDRLKVQKILMAAYSAHGAAKDATKANHVQYVASRSYWVRLAPASELYFRYFNFQHLDYDSAGRD